MRPASDGRKAALAIKIGMKPSAGPDDDDDSSDGGDQDGSFDLSGVVSELHEAVAAADDDDDRAKLSQALQLVMEVASEEEQEGEQGEDEGGETPPIGAETSQSGERGQTA